MKFEGAEVRLFGSPAIVENGVARRIGGPPRTLALLLYLVMHRGAPLERRRVAFALWPDVSEDEAIANLRRHLHALGATLPAVPAGARAWLATTRVSVTWDVPQTAHVDVIAFEDALAERDDAAALELYSGPLCPSIDEEWANYERERLTELALAAFDRSIEREQQRDTQRALVLALESLRIDPWREATIRALIEIRATAGDTAGARRQYIEFAALLEREYGTPPDPRTTETYERIGTIPAVRSRGSLPQHLQPLIGRDEECAAIHALLADNRLVTIVGSGGIGKTRLALAVGADLVERYADGVHFCELVAVADSALAASAIASGAHIAQSGGVDPTRAIVDGYGERLLVIDNCEHVLHETARIVDTILREVPQARLLCTSREPLNLRAETVVRLAPLARNAAVELFAERALAANARFALTSDVRDVVANVCESLDRNALAIELAAARTGLFSVARIRQELDARFDLLVTSKHDVPMHHRALRASLDWSYELLEERDRRHFARLGVFAETFTLDAAIALSSDRPKMEIVEAVASLSAKSLIVPDYDPDLPRFRLLETVRVYARERLEVSGEAAPVRTRHLASVAAAFVDAGERYRVTPRDEIVLALEPLVPDARAALAWARAIGPEGIELGAQLLCSTPLWEFLGLNREGVALAQTLLERLEPGSAAVAASLWTSIAFLDYRIDWSHSADAGTRAVALARSCGEADILADALLERAVAYARSGNHAAAHADLDEAWTVTAPTALRRLLLRRKTAWFCRLEGRLDEAEQNYKNARETYRFLGNRRDETMATSSLAEIEHARGNTAGAIAIATAALQAFPDGDFVDRRVVSLNLSGYYLAQGEVTRAIAPAREALSDAAGNAPFSAYATIASEHVALIAAFAGAFARAAQLVAYLDKVYRDLGMTREYTERVTHAKTCELIEAALTTEAREAAVTEGESWSLDRFIVEARQGAADAAALFRSSVSV